MFFTCDIMSHDVTIDSWSNKTGGCTICCVRFVQLLASCSCSTLSVMPNSQCKTADRLWTSRFLLVGSENYILLEQSYVKGQKVDHTIP